MCVKMVLPAAQLVLEVTEAAHLMHKLSRSNTKLIERLNV
jgi:hypothetical protein